MDKNRKAPTSFNFWLNKIISTRKKSWFSYKLDANLVVIPCKYCVQTLRWNLFDAAYESLNIKVNWQNNTCCASRLHHYLIKILRTRSIAKNSHIFTVTFFIYFHFNNAARRETVHFITSLHREEISRGFIIRPR